MTTMTLPDWNTVGIIPPINELQPIGAERSPYDISLVDFVLRFGTSPERRVILDGFLRYREALHAVGLIAGFQWLDGSFLENIELIESRPPQDIDIVTFFHLPSGASQLEIQCKNPRLFQAGDVSWRKTEYRADAYVFDLNTKDKQSLVERSTYWYSIWSHRRDMTWKGFARILLSADGDAEARQQLNQLDQQEVQS